MHNLKLSFCFTGAPASLDSQQLAATTFRAQKAVEGVTARHGGSFINRILVDAVEDPDVTPSVDSDAELQIWKLLPQLRNLPESLLGKIPLATMFQLNAALQKEKKHSEKLGVNSRLAQNAKTTASCPTKVAEGLDNRRDLLHSARFLGGACSSLTEQWAAARTALGETGVVPLGNYDLDAIGCGGSVTPKAWMEIHNPASQELKIKLFHMPNVANSGLSKKQDQEGSVDGDSLREIADLDSFKVALNTAREAMTTALPWNRSIGAIVGLMVNTNYLQEDIGGNPKRAAILAEFTDYILGRNALNWENCQSFLTTDELTHVWANWKAKRGILMKPAEKKKDKESSLSSSKKAALAVCRLWNSKACKAQADKECKSAWGKTLKHACNKYMPGGKLCLKDHPRCEHV